MNLKFPVFVARDNDKMVYTFFNYDALRSTNTYLLKKKIFNGCNIIDSRGKKVKIINASFNKYKGLFGINPLLKGRQILIDFEFSDVIEIITLEDLKKELYQKIDNNKSYWSATWDINVLKNSLCSCQSFEDVAQLIK